MLYNNKVTYRKKIGTLQRKRNTVKPQQTKPTVTEQTLEAKPQTADDNYRPPPAERLKNNNRNPSANEAKIPQHDHETAKGREYARQQRKSRSQRYSPKLPSTTKNDHGVNHEQRTKKQKSEGKKHTGDEYNKRIERQPIKDHQKPCEDKEYERELSKTIFKTTQQIHRRYQKQEYVTQTEVLTIYFHAPPNFTPSKFCALGGKIKTLKLYS